MDDEESSCPLCMEDLDVTDRNFRPCPCGYQVCLWCYHHIKENLSGQCPACRRPYEDATITADPEEIAKLAVEKKKADKQEKKQRSRDVAETRPKPAVLTREQLQNVRVIQRTLVYVVGLSPRIAREEHLRRPEFFGQYGRIIKIAVNTAQTYNAASSYGQSLSCYVTYAHKEEALNAILATDGVVLDGRTLRAQFGTTKYCAHYIRHNAPCNNAECMFLHEIGDSVDTYSKEEMAGNGNRFHNETHPATSHRAMAAHAANGGRPQLHVKYLPQAMQSLLDAFSVPNTAQARAPLVLASASAAATAGGASADGGGGGGAAGGCGGSPSCGPMAVAAGGPSGGSLGGGPQQGGQQAGLVGEHGQATLRMLWAGGPPEHMAQRGGPAHGGGQQVQAIAGGAAAGSGSQPQPQPQPPHAPPANGKAAALQPVGPGKLGGAERVGVGGAGALGGSKLAGGPIGPASARGVIGGGGGGSGGGAGGAPAAAGGQYGGALLQHGTGQPLLFSLPPPAPSAGCAHGNGGPHEQPQTSAGAGGAARAQRGSGAAGGAAAAAPLASRPGRAVLDGEGLALLARIVSAAPDAFPPHRAGRTHPRALPPPTRLVTAALCAVGRLLAQAHPQPHGAEALRGLLAGLRGCGPLWSLPLPELWAEARQRFGERSDEEEEADAADASCGAEPLSRAGVPLASRLHWALGGPPPALLLLAHAQARAPPGGGGDRPAAREGQRAGAREAADGGGTGEGGGGAETAEEAEWHKNFRALLPNVNVSFRPAAPSGGGRAAPGGSGGGNCAGGCAGDDGGCGGEGGALPSSESVAALWSEGAAAKPTAPDGDATIAMGTPGAGGGGAALAAGGRSAAGGANGGAASAEGKQAAGGGASRWW